MIKVGTQLPYFEFLDGIKGKSLYDLKQKYHIVIYKTNSDKDFLEEMENEFERANTKLINTVQITDKKFEEKLGIKEDEDFILIADRYGNVIYTGNKIPDFKEIMNIIFFAENEGCCPL